MANYSLFSNVYGSLRSKTPSAKKVPFRSANPVQLPGTSLNINSDVLDGVSTLAPHNLMADCTSPVRGRTLKEYDQLIGELKNENFNLKLRIYLLEERIQHKFGDSLDDVHKHNFELQVQVETLKKELATKKELLVKAAAALEALEVNHKMDIGNMQQQFAEQRKLFEQQVLQLQDPSSHSLSTDESQSHREDFYEQAFLPLNSVETQSHKEMELEAKVNELQVVINENQEQLNTLQKELCDKDRIIKEEEINSLKRNKVLQALVAAVKKKEKELIQLKEIYQPLMVKEQKCQKDQKEKVKEISAVSSGSSDSGEMHTENVAEEFQKENERLQAALRDALNQKDAIVEKMQLRLNEQLREKDEIIEQLQLSIRNRDIILKECLETVGVSNYNELLQGDANSITKAVRLKLDEKENKTQCDLEQKIKTLKERDNEIVQLQVKIGDLENGHLQLKDDLKRIQESNVELQDELNQRDLRLQELLERLNSLHEELKNTKERHSVVINEKDALIRRLQVSYVNNEREMQDMYLSNKENVDALSSDSNNLQKCINEKDKLIEELINDKNKSIIESERSLQSLTASLRDKDMILKDVHDRLVKEQNNRVAEWDQLQLEIDKKAAEVKNLESRMLVVGEQHDAVISNLKITLEEKDKMIKSLVETNTREETKFKTRLTSCQDDNEDTQQGLKKQVDALNKQLNIKTDYIFSVEKSIKQLMRQCVLSGTHDDGDTYEFSEISLKENIECLEQKISNFQQQSQHWKEMFKTANNRIKALRSLVQKSYGVGNMDGSGDTLSNEQDNLLDNVKSLLNDVKLIVNLNDMLQHCIKLNRESSDEKRSSLDSQLLADMSSEIQHMKEQLAGGFSKHGSEGTLHTDSKLAASPPVMDSKSKTKKSKSGSSLLISITPKFKSGFVDSGVDLESGQNSLSALQLQDARNEIQVLKDKLASTENTVHKLGTKVKEYRKRLSESENVTTPLTPPHRGDVTCFLTPTSCHTDEDSFREATALATRRSVSAEDVGTCIRSVTQNDQALSAEDVLNTATSNVGEGSYNRTKPRLLEMKDFRSSSCRLSTPYTPDSVNEFGQTDDVLELKEQIFWLKLRFEEQVHELKKSTKKNECHVTSECQTEDSIEKDSIELQYLQQQNSILQMKLDTLLAEIPEGKHSSFIQLQRQEIHSLRSHLGDSHNACELLRVRLEELAEFLEQLLQFDENGLLDLTRFTPQRIASLQLQIAQSRDLSVNLSQSLMIDGDMSMISSCVESTHLYEHENITLTDNDTNLLMNQSTISTRCKTYEAEKPLPQENESSNNTGAKGPQWRKCGVANGGKQTQSSYDDLVLLLDTNVQERFKLMADGKQSLAKRLEPDVRNLASEQEQAIHEYVRRDSALQHKLDKIHQSLKDSYQLVAGDFEASREFKKQRAAISPTDSESWSEPDRDVSQQRMGIEPEFLSPGDKGSLVRSPRSSHHRSLRSGSSNTEENMKKPHSGRKGRNDPSELWRQHVQIQNLEEVNASLRSELDMCHALLKGSLLSLDGKINESTTSAIGTKRPISASAIRKRLFNAETGVTNADETPDDDWHNKQMKQTGNLDEDSQPTNSMMNWELNKEISSLQQQVQMLYETIQSKDDTIQQLKKNLSSSNNIDNQLKDSNHRLQNSLSQLQIALKDKETVCQELREANVRLQNLLDVVDKMVREKDDELSHMKKEKAQMMKETEGKTAKLREKAVQLKQLLEEVNRKSEEKLNVLCQTHASELLAVQQKHQTERETSSRLLEDREAESVKAKRIINQLLEGSTKKDEELRTLQKKFEEMKAAILETEKQLEMEHGQNLTLQEKVNTLNKFIFDKDKNSLAMQERILELESVRNQLEKETLGCEAKIAQMESSAGNLEAKLAERDREVGSLNQLVGKMQEVIAEKKSTLERQLEKARNLEEKVEILSSSATATEQRCQQECATKHRLQDKLRQAKEMETLTKSQMKNHQQSCDKLKDSLATQEKKYLDLQNKLDERGDVIRKLEEELHQSWEENEKLQQQIISVQTMLHETNNLNKSMKTELQVYEHLHLSSNSDKSDSKESSASNRDISELLQEIRSLRTQLELSIQTSSALRHRLEQQLACQTSERRHSVDKTPCKEVSSQPCSDSDPNNAAGRESENVHEEMKKTASWGEKLQQSQHFSRISSNSIESGQFSDIDMDKQGRYAYEVNPESRGDSTNGAGQATEVKTNQKTVNRKKRPTNLVISKQCCMSGTMDLSAGGCNEIHSVYSSPDLGIESDPSHFSYLEQQMNTITNKHLREIRAKSNGLHKGHDKDVFPCNGAEDVQIEADRRLLYAIGRLDDYELLKKEMEEMAKLLKQVHMRVKERLRFALACDTVPVKDVQQVTWKDIQVSISNITTCLNKSLHVVGSFWTAMLPSESGISKAEFEKMTQTNSMLRKKIRQQKKQLQDALQKLAASNRLKDGMEQAIMKQLTKTHEVLKKANGNLADHTKSPTKLT